MLNLSDCMSLPVFLPAIRAAGAAGMSWRGAHISGDRTRKHTIIWGLGSVATFLVTLVVGALANHDATDAIKRANDRAKTSEGQLQQIQRSVTDLKMQNTRLLDAMNQIAGVARLEPNQSTQALADQIIKKLSDFQNQLDQTKSHVEALENPPPDQNTLYQSGRKVGNVIRGHIDQVQKLATFDEVDDAGGIDSSRPINIRSYTIICPTTIFSFLVPRRLEWVVTTSCG